MPSIDISHYKAKPKKSDNQLNQTGLLELLNRDIHLGSKNLSDKKKESLYLELSSLLQAGIDLKSSLELISADQKGRMDKQLFSKIQLNVLNGSSFSQALKISERFSKYEIFSLQIGEETGKMVEILKELATFYHNKIKQRRKIISALTYPCVVLATSFGAVFFMLKFVVPMFGDVFIRFGGELPWITAQIINLSEWMQKYFYFFLIFIIVLAVLAYLFRKTTQFRKLTAEVVLKLPVIGNLVQKIYLARLCNSMKLLINAKLPLLRALNLTSQMIGFYPIESSLKCIEDDILKGKSLHQSLQSFSIYPSKMVMLLKVGEETNQLDYFFSKLSEQYIDEVEYKTSTISSLMEPLIIIFLGIIVGVILVSMYLPLFKMSNSF